MFTFCDNSFNVPKKHAEAICREIIDRKLDIRWGTGALKPIGITDDFCRLLLDSGCGYINLAVKTASEKMLQSGKRGYHVGDVEKALACFGRSDIPFGSSLMFGAPGETPETISETCEVIDRFQIPLEIWVTMASVCGQTTSICLRTRVEMVNWEMTRNSLTARTICLPSFLKSIW
jgi:tRNA A37 methylthiotransferase MiaB